MRLAIISDIHGNALALDAVLRDIDLQGGVDHYWFLGDFAAIGPDPVGIMERVTALPHSTYLRGNTDRYLFSGAYAPPTVEAARQDPALIPVLAEVARSFAWTQGALVAGGWLDLLADLPIEQRLALPDGTRILGVHASPGSDDGDGIQPWMDDTRVTTVFGGCEADIVFVGHVHWPQDRQLEDVRVVNVGAVSNPFPLDLRASYVLLTADAYGHTLEFCRAAYDHEAVIESLARVRHPAASFIIRHQRGEAVLHGNLVSANLTIRTFDLKIDPVLVICLFVFYDYAKYKRRLDMPHTVWIELPVHDIERALKFYQAVFDVQPTEINDDGVRRTATLFSGTQQGSPGISLNQTANFEPGDKGPYVYLDAGEDLTGHLQRVEPAGGKVLTPKTSMGQAGNYASILDTEGNLVGLYSPK